MSLLRRLFSNVNKSTLTSLSSKNRYSTPFINLVAIMYVIVYVLLCGMSVLSEAAQRGGRSESRIPVRYATLGSRDSARDPHTLVEVTSFLAINKFQPFHVSISSNALLLLDFHSHLTRSEVVGYLGGRWDTNSQLLTVLRAFPCRSRLRDTESATATEEEVIPGAWLGHGAEGIKQGGGYLLICQSLFLRGLSLVGWYHSHPLRPALPSLQDIEAQMDYQLKLQGSDNCFQPCLGLICGESPLLSCDPPTHPQPVM
ncbi:hypothetical protein FKM82_014986 [Ascaphus truei]